MSRNRTRKTRPSHPAVHSLLANPNHSTGPRTDEGKAISSRNALKHGGAAASNRKTGNHGACSTATLILACESLEDFQTLEKRWFKAFAIHPGNPGAEYEAELIRTAVRAEWFFLRADRNYAEVEARMMNDEPNMLLWGNDHHRVLQRFLRYRTAHANSAAKHRKTIEDYRKNRSAEAARAHIARHKEETLAIAKSKLEIFKQKHPPEPTGNEELENTQQQAIRISFRQASSE